MFDLPTLTKSNRREYGKFRRKLMNDGFLMVQFSIYSRFCKNLQDANKHISRVRQMAPSEGNLRILSVTEKQYEDMIMILGEMSESERSVGKEFLTVIE